MGDLDTAFRLIGSLSEYAMRSMRYEVFAWAHAALQASGASDHEGVALLTGMHAYGAWVRGEFELAVSLADETRRLEAGNRVFPSGLAERVYGNVLYMLDRSDLGNLEAARQVELAEQSGSESRLVHACYMYAVVLSSEGRYDEASQLVLRARVHAEMTQSPTDLASVAAAEGFSTSSEDAALAAFMAADRIASCSWQPLDERVRSYGGERPARAPRCAYRGLHGPRRDGGAVVSSR